MGYLDPMAYQKILVATDLSATAENAVKRSIDLARSFGSELTVIHVIEHFPEDLPATFGGREDQDPRNYLLDSARHKLADLVEKLGMPSLSQHVMLSTRSARHEIIAAAKHLGADLVVLGAPPHGLMGHLGSTTSALIHTSPCDVLVIRAPA